MGFVSADMSHVEFAEKLKQQPESVGYLVIHTAKSGLPGAWRRIARRDEHILQKDYGLEATRLKSIDGGNSDDEYAQVELWILPKSALPPAGATEKHEGKPGVAFKLNSYDANSSEDEGAEQWMLENLAEVLRADPRASGYIIAREPEEPAAADSEEPAFGVEDSSPDTIKSREIIGADAEVSGEEAESEEIKVEISVKELIESWKKTLSEKYGIAANRVIVLEGRPLPWSNGRLTTWVVPENAQPPDPLARDADEPEEETPENKDAQAGASEAMTTIEPPRFEK